MTNPVHARRLSVEDYLAAEDGADIRLDCLEVEVPLDVIYEDVPVAR